jgi:hypothetical protein
MIMIIIIIIIIIIIVKMLIPIQQNSFTHSESPIGDRSI